MATQAPYVRRKQETDKNEKNPESKERPPRAKQPPNTSPLKGKAKKNEGPFLVDSENFNETSVLPSSTAVDFTSLDANRSTEEIGVQSLNNESIVDNMLPAVNNRFNDDSFHQLSDFGKVALPAGNNNFVDIASSQGYSTYITSSMQTTNTTSAIDSGVVTTTNIGSADSSKGVYSFTPLSTPEAVAQFNNTGVGQEITRVTLSSVHKVEGNKESTPIRAASTSFINNSTAPGNIIEKTIGHTDASVFDAPINKDALYNIDPNNRTDNITQTNPMINTSSHGFQSNMQSHLSTYDSERIRSSECEGSVSNTHLVGVAGPSEIPSNPQPTVDQPSTKASGRGRPKKTAGTTRGRPKKVKPNETQIGVEGVTTEVKSIGNESSKKMPRDLPEVEGLSVAVVNENATKTNRGKRGRPSKISQTGGLSTNIPKKRGRPKKEEINNDASNINPTGTTIYGKTSSKRGRPRKVPKVESHLTRGTKHSGRGRPRRVPKVDDQREKVTTGIKRRGRPRKEVSESSEPKGAPEGSELKAPEGSELKAPESSELKQVPESSVPERIELKEAPESSELKEVPEPKDELNETTVGTKTGKRGRPKRISINEEHSAEQGKEPPISKKRGRPKKEASENNEPKTTDVKAGKRGRPRKKLRDEEPSVSSNEPGAASGPVEHQLVIENVPDSNNTSSVPAVDVDGANVTIGEVPVDVADEIPEESVDELIDELTTN